MSRNKKISYKASEGCKTLDEFYEDENEKNKPDDKKRTLDSHKKR